MSAPAIAIETKPAETWAETYDRLQREMWAMVPVTQLDVDIIHAQATGRFPVFIAPFNRRMPSGRLPVPDRRSLLARLWSRVDRETRITGGLTLFALFVFLLVLLDGHSRIAALFT